MAVEDFTVRPFAWQDWRAIWQIRFAQLAEHGIHLDPSEIPASSQNRPRGSYEWDLDHIEQIYLSGAGGFWGQPDLRGLTSAEADACYGKPAYEH